MLQTKNLLTVLSLLLFVNSCELRKFWFQNCSKNFFLALAIWCYRCNSATPGCSDNFNWKGIGYLGDPCPEDDDICVKIVERKGGKTSTTDER